MYEEDIRTGILHATQSSPTQRMGHVFSGEFEPKEGFRDKVRHVLHKEVVPPWDRGAECKKLNNQQRELNSDPSRRYLLEEASGLEVGSSPSGIWNNSVLHSAEENR